MTGKQLRTVSILTLLLGAGVAVASFFGGFVPGTYERDAESMAVQGMGQDLVNLFVVVPLLLISLFFLYRKSRAALLILAGTLFYILYSYVIYAFGVHFNSLFLVYCLVLGLSLYAFIIIVFHGGAMAVEAWFGPDLPVRATGGFLVAVAALFYLLWLKDVLPAVLSNTVPATVSDYRLLVNPVHVLDMAVALPGLVIAAVLLMRKKRLGYILAPVALVFVIILALALIGMVVMLKVKGISEDISIAAIFLVLAVISAVFLGLFLKGMKSPAGGK